jgi:predicted AlkP superfamily phosphohydrolase/phosphomutase
MMVQVHAPDGLNHQIMNGVCPLAPQYDPAKEEETWARFRSEYQVLDRMVGQLREMVDDGETAIIVLSDHGAIPTWKRAWVGRAFEAAGLLTLERLGDGQMRPDYSKSKVAIGDHPLAQNIWVNLKGRDPQGIVEPGEEYERVRDEALRVLRSFTDPETGEHVIALALRKEEAQCLGQWGPRVGDIVYFFAPGYTDKIRVFSAGTMNEADLPANGVEPNSDGMQGYHHPYLPTARAFGCTARAVFLAAGPGFRPGCRRQAPINLVDVTPTVAHLLGFAPPAQSEGGVASGLLTS